jgi:hypothetical protein
VDSVAGSRLCPNISAFPYTIIPLFFDKGLHPLLWAGLRAARGKITVSRIPNCLNYCVMSIVYTQFTNVPTVHILQAGGPRVGDT